MESISLWEYDLVGAWDSCLICIKPISPFDYAWLRKIGGQVLCINCVNLWTDNTTFEVAESLILAANNWVNNTFNAKLCKRILGYSKDKESV